MTLLIPPPSPLDELLARRAGRGAEAKPRPEPIIVGSSSGLREALIYCHTYPSTIYLAPGRYPLEGSRLDVPSQTAVIGLGSGGAGAVITDGGFRILGHDVILAGYPGHLWLWAPPEDGVLITGPDARNITLDRLRVSQWGDGAYDITREATDITLRDCIAEQGDKAVLIGHADDRPQDAVMRVSIIGGWYSRVGRRAPCRVRRASVEIVSTTVHEWDGTALDASQDARVVMSDCRFKPLPHSGPAVRIRDGATLALRGPHDYEIVADDPNAIRYEEAL